MIWRRIKYKNDQSLKANNRVTIVPFKSVLNLIFTRQSKRAHVYESAVTHGEPEHPVAVKALKRSTSFINPLAFFRRPEAARDNSRVYYIYSNPLPVGLNDEEEEEHKKATSSRSSSRPQEQPVLTLPPSLQEYASMPDPSSGFVLDPPIFYMQL